MEFFQAIAIAIVACIVILQLKSERAELAFVLSVAAGILILALVAEKVQVVLSTFQEVAIASGMQPGVYLSLLKMVGIGYVTEIACDTVEDFGSKSLAGKIALVGKITVFMLAMPIFQNLLTIITEFL